MSADNLKDRSAVYYLDNKNLTDSIKKIIEIHSQKPLTDEELKGYVWPDGVLSANDLMESLFKKLGDCKV